MTRRAGRAEAAAPPLPARRWRPRAAFLPPTPPRDPAPLRRGSFSFLNETRELGWPPRWDAPRLPHLWAYNLHYFDLLWDLSYGEARDLAADWIARADPERCPVGWEPYPTSLRLVNWCAFFFARHAERTESDGAFAAALWASIFAQAERLRREPETHLLGNHLLENAAALALLGSCFEGPAADAWYRAGRRLLAREVPEQILADGAHFERSPMYQLRMIWVVTALVNGGDTGLRALLAAPLERMVAAARQLCHPDGEVALLNDSAFGIYCAPAALFEWATRVAGEETAPEPATGIFALREAGYYGARSGDGHYLVCDAAPIGPDYLPGHAHGDIFSFELSLGGQRVVCDAGVFGYEPDAMRRYCRSTRAHSTVEVEERDQCEFWAAFRVARRGRPRDVCWERTEGGFRLEAWHDGYRRLRGRPRHRREFSWHERGVLRVRDSVHAGVPVRAASRLHLHPDCQIARLDARGASVAHPGGAFEVHFTGDGALASERAWYCPRFGVRLESQALVFRSAGSEIETGFCIVSGSDEDARTLPDALLPS